jgi:hypothetical protein
VADGEIIHLLGGQKFRHGWIINEQAKKMMLTLG